MEMILICLAMVINTITFFVGIIIGQKFTKNEPINVANPITAIKEHKEQEEALEEYKEAKDQMQKELQNIDNYNGSELGQIEIR
jgi:Skp family chaperone for outer membrane proteins